MEKLRDHEFPPLPSQKVGDNGSSVAGDGVSCIESDFATINDLPEELILEILRYLPGIDVKNFHLPSLLSLSRTSQRFHRLVAKELNKVYNSHFCEPYLFLRTVITNAALASHVRHADLTYGTWAHHQRKRYIASAQDKKIIKEGLKAMGMPDWKTWATDCNTNLVEVDTLYTATLLHTPNISSLNITDGQIGNYLNTKPPKWIDLLRRADHGTSRGRMHRFQSLRSIRIEVGELTLANLAPVFRTGSLRKLHLKRLLAYDTVGRNSDHVLSFSIPPRYNNLEEIYLEDSVVQIDSLGVIIASAQSLKTFRYEMTPNIVSDPMDANLQGKHTLGTVLSCHKATLEHVTFLVDTDPVPHFPRTFNLHGELQGFTVLRHLRCAFSTIIDWKNSYEVSPFDKLPRSLNTLHLVVDEISKGDFLKLEQSPHELTQSLPLLQELRVSNKASFRGIYDWTRLVAAFSQTEINLLIEDEEDKGDGWSEQWGRAAANTHVPPSDVESVSSGDVSLYSNE
jgi:hypothetical protein